MSRTARSIDLTGHWPNDECVWCLALPPPATTTNTCCTPPLSDSPTRSRLRIDSAAPSSRRRLESSPEARPQKTPQSLSTRLVLANFARRRRSAARTINQYNPTADDLEARANFDVGGGLHELSRGVFWHCLHCARLMRPISSLANTRPNCHLTSERALGAANARRSPLSCVANAICEPGGESRQFSCNSVGNFARFAPL